MEFDDQVDSDVLQFNVDPSELQACLLYATSSGEDDPISMSKASVDAHSEDEAIKPIVLTRKVKAINKGNLPLTVQDFRIGHWRWFVSFVSLLWRFINSKIHTFKCLVLATGSRSTTAMGLCCSQMKRLT
jgi:hypothetical protein